jgi:Tol biopolymer transport system component
MPGVIRRTAVAGALLALAVASATAAASVPAAPQLAFTRDGNPLPGEELLTTDPSGERWSEVMRSPHASGSFQHLSWSADGSSIAFGGSGFFPRERVFTIPADGGTLRPVRGTRRGFIPVFSPVGDVLAFAKFLFRQRSGGRKPYISVSIWLVDAGGGGPRQLTPWRDRLFVVPSSFSPDGSSLLAERDRPSKAPEIVSVPLGGSPMSLIVKGGAEPAYSPDGTAIAFIRPRNTGRVTRLGGLPVIGGDLFVADSDGSGAKRLTFTPNRRETGPSWDPSGQRLAYMQYPAKLTAEAQEGIGSSIMEINADGTCRHRLLFTYGLSYAEPAWRPGVGREAGRIAC